MYRWKDFNINLAENEQLESKILEISCPKCYHKTKKHKNTLYINTELRSWFCKHCGFAGNLYQGFQPIPLNGTHITPWKLNPFISNYTHKALNENIIEKFKKRKISKTTLEHFKVGQTKTYFPNLEENINCIVYPYYQNYQLVNLVYFNGNYRTSEIGGVKTCFNYDKINIEHTFIVFDELEVLTFFECDKENVISLFGGNNLDSQNLKKNTNLALEFLQNVEEKIEKIKKITIAFPNNEIANYIKDELIRRLGKERCWIVQPPENNYSWNDVFVEYGKDKLLFLLETAKPIPVRGIFEIDDIEEKFDELYHKGFKKGALTGWPTLDKHYTVVPGQWTIVTGIPSHGKSNFLDALFVNLAKNEDWKFAIFSPENQPLERHFANIIEKYFGQPFDLGRFNRISEEQKEEGKAWLRKHFSIILPHEDDSWSIDGILDLAKVLVYRKGINGLAIDPWNEMDHSRPPNQTETEYTSYTLTKIRQFARNYNVHVWLVAHPTKLHKDKDGRYPVPTPYDISGSAHYRNKADNAITIWRNVGYEDQNCVDIHVQKIRFKEVGKVGLVSLRYDFISGAFIDDIDQDKRKTALENGEIIPTEMLRRKI